MVAFNTDLYDMTITTQCDMCAANYVIFLKQNDYKKWLSEKGYIQDLMPYLSSSERELLISHTCGDCFDKMFPSYEDEE